MTGCELRFEAREPFFPSFHECPHLRRHQPALEAPARAASQCAEYVFRREAVQQFAIGGLHVGLPLGRQAFLEREQAAADPALHAAQRIGREPRDLIVRTAFDERQREALARVVVELPDAEIEVVRLLDAAGIVGGFVGDLGDGVVGDQGHALAAHEVDGAVARDGHHPGERAAAVRLELRGALPDAHVDVLQHFFGHRAAAQHAQQAREQDGRGLVVQRAEGRGVLRRRSAAAAGRARSPAARYRSGSC